MLGINVGSGFAIAVVLLLLLFVGGIAYGAYSFWFVKPESKAADYVKKFDVIGLNGNATCEITNITRYMENAYINCVRYEGVINAKSEKESITGYYNGTLKGYYTGELSGAYKQGVFKGDLYGTAKDVLLMGTTPTPIVSMKPEENSINGLLQIIIVLGVIGLVAYYFWYNKPDHDKDKKNYAARLTNEMNEFVNTNFHVDATPAFGLAMPSESDPNVWFCPFRITSPAGYSPVVCFKTADNVFTLRTSPNTNDLINYAKIDCVPMPMGKLLKEARNLPLGLRGTNALEHMINTPNSSGLSKSGVPIQPITKSTPSYEEVPKEPKGLLDNVPFIGKKK